MSNLLGSIIYIPSGATTYNNDNSVVLYNLYSENSTIDSCSINWNKSDSNNVSVLYEIIHEFFLDGSNNGNDLTFLELLEKYKERDFDYLIESFTLTVIENYIDTLKDIQALVNSLSDGLDKDTFDTSYAIFEPYKKSIVGLVITQEERDAISRYINLYYDKIDSINQSINIYTTFLSCQETYTTYKIANDIIQEGNYSSLEDVLTNTMKSKQINSLNIKTTLKTKPQLVSTVESYVVNYGWPDDGVFESKRLVEIIASSNPI